MSPLIRALVVALCLVGSLSARAEDEDANSAPVESEAIEGVPAVPPGEALAPAAAPVEGGRFMSRFDDPARASYIAAVGSVEVCEALTAPLGIVPYVGSALGTIVEWACLIPGALGASYVSEFHGERQDDVWQPAVGLLLGKLWRDLTRWPVIIAIGTVSIGLIAAVLGLGLAGPLVGLAALPAAYVPVAIAGVVVGAGATYVVFRKLRKKGQEWIFEGVHQGLTREFPDESSEAAAQADAWVKAPLDGIQRVWALASVSAGSDPETEPLHLIPVAGRIFKAEAANAALKQDLRTLGAVVLDEPRDDDLGAVDLTVDILGWSEGGLAAFGELGLVLGGLAFVGGSTIAAVDYQQSGSLNNYGVAIAAAGFAGIGLGGLALGAFGLREIPQALRPIAVPIAWGVFPPDDGSPPGARAEGDAE